MTLRTPLFLVALFMLAACFVISGCLKMDAVTEIISEKHSPDDLWTAAVYTSDAGATTSTATIVNLRSKARRFSEREDAGNIFVVTYTKLVEVEWVSKDKLLIKVQGFPRVFRQLVKNYEISISYEGVDLEKAEAPR